MTNEREVRFLPMEIRAEQDEEKSGAVIEGYPIVFNQETDLGEWREVIEPAAVSEKILRDVALMVGHDFGMIPLAHSRRNNENSTMQLTADETGVKMRATLDVEHNPKAAEAYSAIRRGDMSGMSFAFIVNEDRWENLDTDKPLRRITGMSDIFEVSLVAFPAYKGTSVQAASEGPALESVRASLESARQQLAEERAKEADQERRTAVLDWLENYKKEEKADV
jgi:HK97 family phage prohead protease